MRRLFASVIMAYASLFMLVQGVYATDKPTVFVSVLPQKFFVQQISTDHVNVEVMVQPGASPTTYEPKSSQMQQLASASAYFAIGVQFEHAWLEKIAGVNPEMKVVQTDKGIHKLAMANHRHDREHHTDVHHDNKIKQHEEHFDAHDEKKHDHHHEHDGLDPHIWLSPSLVKKQAAVIAEELSKILPKKTSLFQQNFDIFAKQIDILDNDLHATFKGKDTMEFMVFHPSWGYFARDYGLKQVAIEIEGKSPKPAHLQKLIEFAREHDIHVIFVQPQFSTKSATVIAREIRGKVISVDPLAEDWLTNMRIVADKFKSVLQ